MAFGRRLKMVLVSILVIGALAGYQALKYWWYKGYSRGSRTGVVRKLSIKGPPYCKYIAGELSLTGSAPGQPAEIWEFSLDNKHESNPLYHSLQSAERNGKPVTLEYRQDLKMWWRCTPSEYFVTGVQKADK